VNAADHPASALTTRVSAWTEAGPSLMSSIPVIVLTVTRTRTGRAGKDIVMQQRLLPGNCEP